MQIEGNTETFSLSEFLALMIDSSVTGVLEIGAGDMAGRIFCRDSRVYHAEAGDQTGLEAIRLILQAGEARFRFVSGPRHDSATFWPTQQMLLGFARRHEQIYRQLRRHIPNLGCIPSLRESSDGRDIIISAAIWPVLALIDGQRSVAEIAEQLGQEPVEVGLMIGDLVGRGLAVVREPPAGRVPVSAALTTNATDREAALPSGDVAGEAQATSVGFFEWLLTGSSKEQPAVRLSRPLALFSTLLAS